MKAQLAPITAHKEVKITPSFTSSFWEDVDRLTKQIEQRAYQLFEWRSRHDGHDLEDWLKAETEFLRWIPVEVTEKDNLLRVTADVPGFRADELEVTVQPSTLTLKGKQEKESEKKEEKTYYTEKQARQIFRSITLPAAIDPEKATATLKDGVLEIAAPKVEQAKQVVVKAA